MTCPVNRVIVPVRGHAAAGQAGQAGQLARNAIGTQATAVNRAYPETLEASDAVQCSACWVKVGDAWRVLISNKIYDEVATVDSQSLVVRGLRI